MHIGTSVLLLASFAFGLGPPSANAQPYLFGSLDDPAEQSNVAWWEAWSEAELGGGLSLIGPQWRSAARLAFRGRNESASIHLEGILRSGIYGTYDADFDEAYDALRLIRYARYRPPSGNTYLRIGPLERTRVGTGHLVNFYSSNSVWNRRTVGAEAYAGTERAGLQVFSEDVTRVDLVGGRVALQPFPGRPGSRLRSVEIGGTVVSDRDPGDTAESHFSAFSADISLQAFHAGGFTFSPFFSYASLQDYGQGFYFGGALTSGNFIDVARIHLKLGLHYNSSDFLPGYFGSFYRVAGPGAAVLETGDAADDSFTSLSLDDVRRSNAVISEIRLLFFERFELWYQFMRHHGVQTYSEYHLRLYFTSERLQLAVGQDRGGLTGFFSIFEPIGPLSQLHFELGYRVAGPVWLSFDARYTYEGGVEGISGQRAYIVQRRFDPLTTVRVRF